MGMKPEDEKTLTIAWRTKKNLDYIYRKKDEGEDVQEFTQLLNSMLGMVISLREDYYKATCISWDQVVLPKGFDPKNIAGKEANKNSPKLKKLHSFSQLVTKLRHAFAHNCFSLEIDKADKITGVTIWNIPLRQANRPENRVWEADITESDLKSLANLVVEHIQKKIGGQSSIQKTA